MTTLDMDFEAAKQNFFDRRAVLRAMDKGSREALSKVGGFVRTTAKRSIRRAGKTERTRVSQPGKPPKHHGAKGGSSPLRDKIFFVYSPSTKSVVVGPLLWKSSKTRKRSIDWPTAAATLEHGGRVRGPTTVKAPGKHRYKLGPVTTETIKPRPYMSTAMKKTIASGKVAQHLKYLLVKT